MKMTSFHRVVGKRVSGRVLAMITALCACGCGGISRSSGGATGGSGNDDDDGTSGVSGTAGARSRGSGDSGGNGSGGSAGSAGRAFTKTGICGQRSTAMVTDTEHEGFEEYFVVSEEAVASERLDEFVCVIRFDVRRAGEAPPGCMDLDGAFACEWSHRIERRNPVLVTNVEGACSNNELAWNSAWVSEVDGSRPAYGYIVTYGHDNVLLEYSEPGADSSTGTWHPFARAGWDQFTGDFRFEARFGMCRY
jgi:hypothetical protein